MARTILEDTVEGTRRAARRKDEKIISRTGLVLALQALKGQLKDRSNLKETILTLLVDKVNNYHAN